MEQEFEPIVDQGEVEEQTIARQAVPSVPSNLDSSFRIIAVQACENLVVGETVLLLGLGAFRSPCPYLSIKVLYDLSVQVSPT